MRNAEFIPKRDGRPEEAILGIRPSAPYGGQLPHFTGKHAGSGHLTGPDGPEVNGRARRIHAPPPASTVPGSTAAATSRPWPLPAGILFLQGSRDALSQPLGPSKRVTSSMRPSLTPLTASLLTVSDPSDTSSPPQIVLSVCLVVV